MPRGRIDKKFDTFRLNRGDPCRVSGYIRGRSVRFNATFLNLQGDVDGEQSCIVRINGKDPWSSKRDNIINVPLSTVKYK